MPELGALTTLRLALTSRAAAGASYCAAGTDAPAGQLSREEIRRLAAAVAQLGFRRIRLTAEPRQRSDLTGIVADLLAIPGVEEVGLSTSGDLLDALAPSLRSAGLSRLAVRLDTLQSGKLAELAGRSAALWRILRGFDAAAAAGFPRLSAVTVVRRGRNDDELGALVRYAWRRRATARLIEARPSARATPVSAAEMREALLAQGVRLRDEEGGWGPRRHASGESEDEAGACAGAMELVSLPDPAAPPCPRCNRIRIGPDGAVRPCAGGRREVPLRDLLQRDPPSSVRIRARLVVATSPARRRRQGPTASPPSP
ncbi:MAG TPA: radical SAM protein [Anaeromyxobacteraceae bacterium]|nr:radical SAM protein [Anaeromyxobacteraceae bacterium]